MGFVCGFDGHCAYLGTEDELWVTLNLIARPEVGATSESAYPPETPE